MKTGSTAFQELLGANHALLEQSGIRFRHLRRQELDDLEAVMEEEEGTGWPSVLLLSHECLCRLDPQRLEGALRLVSVSAGLFWWRDCFERFIPVFTSRTSKGM